VAAPAALDALVSSTDQADQIKLLDHLFTPSGAGARDAYIAGLLRMPDEPVDPQIVARQADAEARFTQSTEVADGLATITSRVLVTDGADDDLVPVANAHLIADHIPDAQLVIVPDSSHAWMLQDLDRFTAIVVAFTDGRPLP
jgi:pimeloyl-ACP methyl ester carboxylesterase